MLSVLFEKDIIKIEKENMEDKDAYIYNCNNSDNKIQMSYISIVRAEIGIESMFV